jgi:hypothetical protein
MSYTPLPDPNEVFDLDLEAPTPNQIEAARLIEMGERHLALLRRMQEVGLGLVERLERIASAGAEESSKASAPAAAIDDLAGAYARITQALRRTMAMEAKLARELRDRRLGALKDRSAAAEDLRRAASVVVDDNISSAMTKVIRRERPDADRQTVERLLLDMYERLEDDEEFEDYHLRPPGETVARLCALFGLDPTFCIHDDQEGWMIRERPAEPVFSSA